MGQKADSANSGIAKDSNRLGFKPKAESSSQLKLTGYSSRPGN